MDNNNLNRYDFIEGQRFIPKSYGVIVSADDKIISVTGDGSLLGVVKLDVERNIISLIGKDGTKFSSAELPLVDVISDAYYDEDITSLVIKVILSDGSEKEILVPFNDLLDDYAKKEDLEKNTEAIGDMSEDILELSRQLAEEVSNRINSDEEIKSLIDTNKQGIIILEGKLSEEINNRSNKDTEIEGHIISLKSDLKNEETLRINGDTILDSSIRNNTEKITKEISDRQKGDTDLLGFLDKEIESRSNADVEIKNTITNLTNTFNSFTSDFSQKLIKEESDRKAKDEELKLSILDEVDRATLAENELERKISAITSNTDLEKEIQDRIAGDNALSERIDSLHSTTDGEIINIKQIIEEINQKVQEEAVVRQESDEEILNKIIEESVLRQDNDNKLQNSINELDNKSVKWTDIHTEELPDRKSIVLKNHDILLGTATDGNTYNLAMLSKWDVADYGSKSVHINLNGKEERPTYNDNKGIAFLDDVTTSVSEEALIRQEKDEELSQKIEELHTTSEGEITSINDLISSIVLVKEDDSNLVYKLMVGEIVKGTINIPKDNFLKTVSYEEETQELKFVFETAETGVQTVSVDLSDLTDIYYAGDGLSKSDNTFNIVVDPSSEEYITVSSNGIKIQGLEAKFINIENTINSSVSETYATKEALNSEIIRATQAENGLSTSINNVLGNDGNTSSDITVYGVRKLAEVNNGILTELESKVNAFDSKFSLYNTKEEDTIALDSLKTEVNTYTDNKCADAITESVTQANSNTTTKIAEALQGVNTNLDTLTDRTTSLEDRADHFDTLFGMILDEHDEPIELKFYTKNEIDTKVEALNEKDNEFTESINAINEKIEDITKGVYNLGEIGSFNNLATLSSAKGVCDNQDNIILTFKITTSTYGQESGFIVNIINGKNISQALYWKQAVKPEMFRTLTISDDGSIDNPDFSPYNYPTSSNNLYIDKLSGYEIFTLTTEATSDEVKAALTDNTINQTVITASQLDECLTTGKFLIDPTMNVPVFVGWNGQGYTLTSFGLPNPFGEAVLSTVTIRISGETYSIVKNGSRSTILTQGNLENNLTKSSTIKSLTINDTILTSKLEMLEQKLEWLSKSNIEEQILSSDSEESYNDITKDYIVSGIETKNVTFNGKSVKFDNVAISGGAITKITASDVELKGVSLSGDFPKENSNAPININDAEFVVIRDMVFDSDNVYNGIEIGLNGTVLPKSILFENCQFLGKFTNNCISIFGTQDNAVINVNNCYFQEMSNPFRLSNRTNTKCTMNIVNCKFDKWETNAPYQGMIILQDYTSSSEEAVNNNLFGDGKITINIINCTKPNGSKITKPSDISTICGSGTDKQLVYVYYDNGGLITYEANKYPIINIG